MLRSARELLGVGVTTARDLGGRGYLPVLVRDAIAADLARGPRLVVSGSPVTVTGGHCWFMGGEADSDDDLRRLVRTHHKHGTDLIKVMSTGGFMTSGSAPWYAQFSTAQLAVIVEEAARVDKPVAAHAHGIEGIQRAVDAGVSTLEHCSFVTETNERQFSEPLAAQIADRGIVVCPTINVNAPYVAKLTGISVGRTSSRCTTGACGSSWVPTRASTTPRTTSTPAPCSTWSRWASHRTGAGHGHHRGGRRARRRAASPAAWRRVTRPT